MICMWWGRKARCSREHREAIGADPNPIVDHSPWRPSPCKPWNPGVFLRQQPGRLVNWEIVVVLQSATHHVDEESSIKTIELIWNLNNEVMIFVKALFLLNPYPQLQRHYFWLDLSSKVERFEANCVSSYKGCFAKESYSNPCVICHLASTSQFVEPVTRFHVS